MSTTNLNIRTDKDVKEKAEKIFNELGLNMTSAVNIFLRTAVRERGIPFELKLDVPNETTIAAIEEGRKMASNPSSPRYSNIDDFKLAKKQHRNLDRLFKVIDVLAAGGTLDEKYRDHALTGNYKGTRECHVEPDCLLIYEIRQDVLVLFLYRLGTHSELF